MPANLLNSLQIVELIEVMSKRRPPTAGMFARLAVASAVACAVLPEFIDFGADVWTRKVAPQAPVRATPGPRVMGSLYTADDDGRGVDRFRFAAGTPFEDDNVVVKSAPGAAAGVDPEPDVPERMSPEISTPAATPVRRQESPEQSAPQDPINAALPAGAAPEAEPEARAREKFEPQIPQQDRMVKPAVEQSVQPKVAPIVPPAVEAAAEPAAPVTKSPTLPAPASPTPSSADLGRMKGKAPENAETGSVTRDAKRAAGAQSATQPARSSGSGAGRTKRRSASGDSDDQAPKPAWRPENLTNWPD